MALNLIFTKPGLSSLPCRRCRRDTLHVHGVCNSCKRVYEPEVIHREVSGRVYHKQQSLKDWERRQAREAS